MSDYRKDHFWNIDRIMTLIIGIAISVGVIFLIRYLSDVLLPFFAACFIAYLLEPIVEFNQKWMRTKRRVLPSIVTIIEGILIVLVLVYLFTPSIVKDVDRLIFIIRKISSGKEELPPYLITLIDFVDHNFKPEQLRQFLSGFRLDSLISKGTSLMEQSIDMIVKTLAWLLTIIYILFILIDYPRISRGFKLMIPYKYREKGMIFVHEVQQSLNHYFRGQGVVALCAAILYSIGFSIIGLPLAIPMGVLVGVLYMIPYFQYITLIPVAAICFIYSLGGGDSFLKLFGEALIVYVVSQSLCDYLITPHIMGKEMGLNSALILLSLSVWGSLLGIIGMIIALPATALIMTYYERYISSPRKNVETPPTNNVKADNESDS